MRRVIALLCVLPFLCDCDEATGPLAEKSSRMLDGHTWDEIPAISQEEMLR
jgi:hypothetical protein